MAASSASRLYLYNPVEKEKQRFPLASSIIFRFNMQIFARSVEVLACNFATNARRNKRGRGLEKNENVRVRFENIPWGVASLCHPSDSIFGDSSPRGSDTRHPLFSTLPPVVKAGSSGSRLISCG